MKWSPGCCFLLQHLKWGPVESFLVAPEWHGGGKGRSSTRLRNLFTCLWHSACSVMKLSSSWPPTVHVQTSTSGPGARIRVSGLVTARFLQSKQNYDIRSAVAQSRVRSWAEPEVSHRSSAETLVEFLKRGASHGPTITTVSRPGPVPSTDVNERFRAFNQQLIFTVSLQDKKSGCCWGLPGQIPWRLTNVTPNPPRVSRATVFLVVPRWIMILLTDSQHQEDHFSSDRWE